MATIVLTNNTMNEIWKDIVGYENRYKASNRGRVKSLDRIIVDKLGRSFTFCEKILKPSINQHGYNKVTLCKDGIAISYRLHRLVAEHFILNPCNYPVINHKDGNKLNNNVDNLEWVDHHTNQKHAYSMKLNPSNTGCIDYISSKTRPIIQIDIKTQNPIAVYLGCTQAARKTGFKRTTLSSIVTGRMPSEYLGFKWRYASKDEILQFLGKLEIRDKLKPINCQNCGKLKHRLKRIDGKKLCYKCIYFSKL